MVQVALAVICRLVVLEAPKVFRALRAYRLKELISARFCSLFLKTTLPKEMRTPPRRGWLMGMAIVLATIMVTAIKWADPKPVESALRGGASRPFAFEVQQLIL
jgi:hypothetical protein